MHLMNNQVLLNDVILRACNRQSVPYTPVWLMRQAGRYMKEFQEIRKKHDFFSMCTNPKIASQVTLLPLEKYPVDAVIIFSDILVIPKALGFEIEMRANVGPVILNSLVNHTTVDSRIISIPIEETIEKLNYVYEAIGETIVGLRGRVPLIGFAGAPWTLMCYMVGERGEEREKFSTAVHWLYEYPQESARLLFKLAEVVSEHLIRQISSGSHLVQIFDSWAGILSPSLYRKFEIPVIEYIVKNVKKKFPDVPIIYFPKGAHATLLDIAQLPFDVISLDSSMDLKMARKLIGDKVALQGNMDPLALYSSKEKIHLLTREMLESYGDDQVGLIANLGHGCLPNHHPDHVGQFIDSVHSISKELISKQ